MNSPINLLDFAPAAFKEHREYLRRVVAYNYARMEEEYPMLDNVIVGHHYVITGNVGVGKNDAAHALFHEIRRMEQVRTFVERDALKLFDPNDGFSSSLQELTDSSSNTMVFISNAHMLGMKGAVNSQSGIDILCNAVKELKECIIVLAGQRSRLMELINSNEQAKQAFSRIFHFSDLPVKALYDYAISTLKTYQIKISDKACRKLEHYLKYAYSMRGNQFTNSLFVEQLIESTILPRMMDRTVGEHVEGFTGADLKNTQVEAADIPEVILPDPTPAIQKLNSLVGLDNIKKRILDHTSLVRLNKIRSEHGLYNKMPPMHMVFTGNPGTGKTTIAKYLGEIYHGIGVLSSGHVVETERSKLIGRFFGDAETFTLEALRKASGGILFIDEAYTLFVKADDTKDYGLRVIETLLTFLSQDEPDVMVILAGYTKEMNEMLESNPGLKSRFPYVFEFEDYTPAQLFQIGKMVLEHENYKLTPEAEKKLSDYIIDEYNHKDEHFGNGRFITRLITTQIIPSLSRRLMTVPADQLTNDILVRIEACDVPSVRRHGLHLEAFDELMLRSALEKLDSLVGLDTVKKALHDYVTISCLQHKQDTLVLKPANLCWEFIGSTGTGKSTVAEILAEILQGLGILKQGHVVSVNAEELAGNDNYQVLERAIKKADDGLLFLDMDAPNYQKDQFASLRMWVLSKIIERHQTTALVVAQVTSGEEAIAKSLAAGGVASYHNSIIFDDFTTDQLSAILRYLLRHDYQLEVSADANKKLTAFVRNIKNDDSKSAPVSARTMQHLSQAIAMTAQLRIASDDSSASEVIAEDVDHFEWTRQSSGRIGF